MSRLPPALLYLTIYNPTLKPTGPVADDDEDAEEQAHILFYTSRERAVSRDKMLRQVGLAKALINFSEMFVSDDACDNVHSQSRRMFMVSPEPGFWIHACIELAKTPRPLPPSKGKSKDKGKTKAKETDKGRNGEAQIVYDYHDGSVHDLALRAQILRGYEEFKLIHGSFTSILNTLGQQALELQLERFFTVWAWRWDIYEDSDFGKYLGVPLHPLRKSIGSLLEDFILDNTSLKDCAPFILSYPHLVPSTSYTANPPSHVLPSYLRSRLRPAPAPPAPTTPSELSPASPKAGADIFVNGMNATREAMEATGQAFVAIGASMDVRKWGWPGYLTFSKGATRRVGLQELPSPGAQKEEKVPADATSEATPDGGATDAAKSEAELQGEVDRESLHEAISSDGIGPQGGDPDEELAPTPHAIEAAVNADGPQQEEGELPEEEEHNPSPPGSPSTPVVRPPNFTAPPSPSSSQGTLPVPAPPPSFRSLYLHFAPPDDSIATAPRPVLYIAKDQLALAFLEPTPALSEEDTSALHQASSAFLANVQGLIDHEEASKAEATVAVTAAKILQPKDKYAITTGKETAITSAEFSSRAEHLFNGSQLISEGDAIEVFSRTQGPQHWHIARREAGGAVYLEVSRKETSLSDVENELAGIVRRFRDSQ
ncbi:hypothetical protein BC834DRAFT_817474 [Gloeopeniophorella convolvens]|nr:hypothetical protein BC834DRAFT_817474 [Gloeopeniophorella convolvens]